MAAETIDLAAHSPLISPCLRRQKIALLFGYVGAGYSGMQRNPGMKTIETDLESSLCRADAIGPQDSGSFTKVVSFRLPAHADGPQLVARVNAELPEQIRVYGYQKVADGFDARRDCDGRSYEYIFPAWLLDPAMGKTRRQQRREQQQHSSDMGTAQLRATQPGMQQHERGCQDTGHVNVPRESSGLQPVGQPASSQQGPADQAPGAAMGHAGRSDHWARLRQEVASSSYVFTVQEQQRLDDLLARYQGTHNFHNFTINVPHDSPDAIRTVYSMRCGGMLQLGGSTWVRLAVQGQSFMLHQIRKMVGMALAVMRGAAPAEALDAALLSPAVLSTPMAPEHGLYLCECFYHGYNSRQGQEHGALDFGRFRRQAAGFKVSHVLPSIAQQDQHGMPFALWLRGLDDQSYCEWPGTVPEGLLQVQQQGRLQGREEHGVLQRWGRRKRLVDAGAAGLSVGVLVAGLETYGLGRPLFTESKAAAVQNDALHSVAAPGP